MLVERNLSGMPIYLQSRLESQRKTCIFKLPKYDRSVNMNRKGRFVRTYTHCFILQTAQNSAIRSAIGMGLFEKIPSSGTGMRASDLSATLNVDERLLSESKAPRGNETAQHL